MTWDTTERPSDPDEHDVMHAWFEQYQNHMHTAIPGRVHALHTDVGTVDVQPSIRHAVPQPDGSQTYEELPILPSVPLIFPRTAEAFVSLPVKLGDTVLVIFCESAIGHWRAGDGAVTHPGDLRRFDLSHAVAIPGLFVRQATLARSQPGGVNLDRDLAVGFVGGVQLALKHAGGAQELIVSKDGTVTLKIDNSGVVHLGAEVAPKKVALDGDAVTAAAAFAAWLATVGTATGAGAPPSPIGVVGASATKAKAT